MTAISLVTLNFWGTAEPLAARLDLAIGQLADLSPDVIALQEVRAAAPGAPTTAEHIAAALDMEALVVPVLSWEAGAFGPGSAAGTEGLAILSRYPIAEHRLTPLPEPRPLERRALLSAAIDHPAAGPIWCHTTHLHYRLADGLARERQVVAIDEVIAAIDSPLPQLLCGDFNATPDHDEIRFLRGLTTLAGRRTHYQDAFLRIHPGAPGYTWSSENEQTRPLRSLDIDRRIDYIFVTSRTRDGLGTVVDAGICLDERKDGICASDHFGVFAEVTITPKNQP